MNAKEISLGLLDVHDLFDGFLDIKVAAVLSEFARRVQLPKWEHVIHAKV